MKKYLLLLTLLSVFNLNAQHLGADLNRERPLGAFTSQAHLVFQTTAEIRQNSARSLNGSNLHEPSWEWATNAGLGAGLSIAVDNQGNSYVAGLLGEAVLAKYSQEGAEIWTRGIGEIGRAVAIDEQGYVYLLGEFRDSISFGDTTITSNGYNAFLAKIDPDGEVLWLKEFGEAGFRYGNSLVVDRFGNCFIAGELSAPLQSDGSSRHSYSGDFVAKLDAAGKFLWIKPFHSYNIFSGYNNLAVDAEGNLFAIGSRFLNGSNSHDAVVLKMDGDGQALWAKKISSSADDFANNIAVDERGNSYITGHIGSSATVSGVQLTPGAFLVKYDSKGKLRWVRQEGGLGVGVDKSGNVHALKVLSGGAGDIMEFTIYDQDGLLLGAQQAGGKSWKYPYAFIVDKAGNSYSTGEYVGLQGGAGEIVFGDTSIYGSSDGSSYFDSFFSKLGNIYSSAPSNLTNVMSTSASVKIFPSAVNDYLTVDLGDSATDEVVELVAYNRFGIVSYTKKAINDNGIILIDMADIADFGLHYLKIRGIKEDHTFRFIKL